MDATEVALVRKTFESALGNASGDIGGLLDDLGWRDLLAVEPAVAVGELFEAQGRLGCSTSALDVVVASALGVPLPEGTAVLHPALHAWDGPPGRAAPSSTGPAGTEIDGLLVAGDRRATRLLVPVPVPAPVSGSDGAAGVLSLDMDDAARRPVAGLDPSLGLVAVTGGSGVRAEQAAAPNCGWDGVALAARRALAHELCGLTQVMLDTAAAHVTERHQFGRPIAAFQTVRHRLTEVYVALASARAALDAGWATGDPLLGDAAKALAGRAAGLAVRHCLRVTGAIGFTEEYPLAARIRRASILDALYGSADELRSRLGRSLLASRAIPRFHPFP